MGQKLKHSERNQIREKIFVILQPFRAEVSSQKRIYPFTLEAFSVMTEADLKELLRFMENVPECSPTLSRPQLPVKYKLPASIAVGSAHYFHKMKMRAYIAQWGYSLPAKYLVSLTNAFFEALTNYIENKP